MVTVVRGRIFRAQVNAVRGISLQAPQFKTKEKRRICVLDMRSGVALVDYGVSEPCFGHGCRHRHLTRPEVVKLVQDGVLKWLGSGHNVAAYSYGREWKTVRSMGYEVKQLV